MADAVTTVGELCDRVREFVRARGWERFHGPKDLAIALSLEASELLERFLWRTEADAVRLSAEELGALADEVADVVIYALSFCNATGLDLSEAILTKMEKNEERYPADRVRGVAP